MTQSESSDRGSLPPDMLAAALRYAAAGWPVFPCQWQKGPRAKQPMVPGADKDENGEPIPKTGGLWRASTDPEQIRAWWRTRPRALIGLPTGKLSGVFVIDLDPRDEHVDVTQARLVDAVGVLPRGPVSRTQSGGRHLWFRLPAGDETPRNSAKRLANIDWRGDGGYVIVPPSVMDDGAAYVWEISPDAAPFPDPPAALLDLVFQRGTFARHDQPHDDAGSAAPRARIRGASEDPGSKAVRLYARAALDRAASDVAQAIKGTRGSTLNAAAFGMAPFVDLGVLSEREVFAALADAADASGLTATDGAQERDAKIRRGLSAGRGHNPELGGRLEQIRREAQDRAERWGTRVSTPRTPQTPTAQATSGEPPEPPPPHESVPEGGPDGPSPLDQELSELPTNDTGNARRLMRRFGDRFRFVREVGPFVWTGTHWDGEGGGELMKRLAQETAAAIRIEARALRPFNGENAKDHEQRVARHHRWSVTSGNSAKIAGMIDQASPHCTVGPEDLDTDPLLLNVANGTLNFGTERDGESTVARIELRPHRREDLLSKIVDAEYDPDAPAERWLAFLVTVVPDLSVRRFLQVWCGYCLTGLTTEQKLVFLFGSGANGKSTFVDILARIFKGYGASLRFESLSGEQSRRGDSATPDLARLPGVRFLRAAEPEQGVRFKEAEIKAITGGEPMLVRHLHGRFFELRPCFKLVLSGNHKPDIRGLDEGIWRRILLVPFTVTVPAGERDPALPDKLWAERSGILNWLLDGLRIYLEQGLEIPTSVQDATAEYRDDQDLVGSYLRSCTVQDPTADVQAGELYKSFTAWCEDNGLRSWTGTAFGRAVKQKGIERSEGRVRRYLGIRLVSAATQAATDEVV